jgi:hypothetical protein
VRNKSRAFQYRSVIAAILLAAISSSAQTAPGPQWEGRADVFLASTTTVQGAAAVAFFLDPNVRLVALGGAGSTFSSGAGEFSARFDLLGRFVLDPDRKQEWALYGTGGLSLRYQAAPSWRGALVALVGLEGPKWGSWTPFVEAGYGGGVQIGFGLRRATAHGR